MSTITTYTGRRFDPLHPDPDAISAEDIAHALSLLCRAGGHFAHFYSVAQHSVNCAKEALARGYTKRVALGCLLHDASEAYLSDITRPVKAHLPRYLDIEKTLQDAIYRNYLTPMPNDRELALIREIDDTLLYHEFLAIMKQSVFDTAPPLYADCSFAKENFEKIETEFLTYLDRLTKG